MKKPNPRSLILFAIGCLPGGDVGYIESDRGVMVYRTMATATSAMKGWYRQRRLRGVPLVKLPPELRAIGIAPEGVERGLSLADLWNEYEHTGVRP